MSPHPEPPPYGAYGAYGARPAPPSRRRPSPRWFVLGAVLLVVGAGLSAAALIATIRGFTQVEASVADDGVTRTLRLETGEDYLLWARPGESPRCVVADPSTGDRVELRGLDAASYTRQTGGSAWRGTALLTAPGERLDVSCAPGEGAIEVGERPQVHTLVGGVLLGLVLPILMAVAGVLMLLVTAILYVVRPASPEARPPGPTPR